MSVAAPVYPRVLLVALLVFGACGGTDGGDDACQTGTECPSGVCEGGNCIDATCTDGVKNSDESGVDCGGAVCQSCQVGGGCVGPTDCVSGVCQDGFCAGPTCTDGVQNDAETAVDCGGTCGLCEGAACTIASQCASNFCETDGTCGPVLCATAPCKNGGICSGDGVGGFTCECPATWTGATCQTSNGCATADCGEGTCVDDGAGGHTCTCPAGQFDDGTCKTCAALTNCDAVVCTSATDSSCTTCEAGYELDGGACANIDDCAADPCGPGSCVDEVAGYRCDCSAGFYDNGTTCGACEAVANCDTVACTGLGDSTCSTCADGFTTNGLGGCTDADDCTDAPCGVGSCVDLGTNSFRCDCPLGFYDDASTCASCGDLPNCAATSCTDLTDLVCATCSSGFESNGAGGCKDVDNCATNPCGAGTCTDAGTNAYDCTCPGGTFDNGLTCATCSTITNCTVVACSTANDASCTTCGPGFEVATGACVDIDACRDFPCDAAATCDDLAPPAANGQAGRECTCTGDLVGSGDPGDCRPPNACIAPATTPLILTGIIDADLPGGLPKAVEIFVAQDIADLSRFGLGTANNGGGTNGQEFTFPAVAAASGTFITVSSDRLQFAAYFGVEPNFQSSIVNLNGDDAVELFGDGAVIDTFGQLSTAGTGTAWDYTDGWAYRGSVRGGSGTDFDLGEWTFSGPGGVDGCATTNANCPSRFPFRGFVLNANPCTNGTCSASGDGFVCACGDGRFFADDRCEDCTEVAQCQGGVTCTDTTDSQCADCADGFYGGACAPCTPVGGCAGDVTCTTNSDSACELCALGRYGPTCELCPDIVGCVGAISCSDAVDGTCSACVPGRYGPRCAECRAIANCEGEVTCTSSTNSVCSDCAPGFFGPTCSQCTPVPGCVGAVTCTTGGNSQCSSCEPGTFGPTCAACSPVAGCVGAVTCSSSGNSQCSACQPGTWGPQCTACAPIAGCDNAVTCTNGTNSVCGACPTGTFGDQCTPCATVPGCLGAVSCTTNNNSVCSSCPAGTFGPQCTPCGAIAACEGAITCTSANNSQCTQCAAGTYGAQCTSCAPIASCDGAVTCTNAGNSVCDDCADGFYGPTCSACTPVAGCLGSVTCTNDDDSVCSSCPGGTWGDQCTLCTDISNCEGFVTCTNNTNSVCDDCASGFFGPTCAACTPVAGCIGAVSCTTSADSVCSQCPSGTFGPQCTPCSPLSNCDGAVTCTTSGDSTCDDCAAGFYGPTCSTCTPVAGCLGSVTCTTNTDSVCSQCPSGTFGPQCTTCSPLSNCDGAVTCTTSGDSTCDDCAAGFYGPTCSQCTPVSGCLGSVTCTTNLDSLCSQCLSGTFGPQCTTCTDISNCEGFVTCTTSANSVCDDCANGFYGPTCAACTPVAGCLGSVTCTTNTDSVCSQCPSGTYGPQCETCPPVDQCAGTVTCSDASDSTCSSCAAGYFGPTCSQCTPVLGCTGQVTCTTAGDSVCSTCPIGTWGDQCTACPTVPNCNGVVSCSSATNSTCSSCDRGFYGPTCAACTTVDNCQGTVSCTTASDSVCSSCPLGTFGPQCTACAQIAQCATAETCTTAGDSTCATCNAGFYGPTCSACPTIDNCATGLTCDAAGDSTCATCNAGFYGPTCSACPTIENCQVPVTCDATGTSTCATCDAGFYGPTCSACSAVAGCATVTCEAAGASTCTSCTEGYVLSGATCVDINACLTNPCDTNASCLDKPAPALGTADGRTCTCNVDFVGSGEPGACAPACNLDCGVGQCTLGTCSDCEAPVSLARFTFETSVPTAAGPHAAESGLFAADASASASNAPGAAYSNPGGNGSPESFSANNWRNGDYFQVTIPTQGAGSLAVAWDQTRSSTGPANFRLEWSVDGTTFESLSTYTVAVVSWSAGTTQAGSQFRPVDLPEAANDLDFVYIRFTSLDTTAAAGTNRIDNIELTGTLCGTGPCSLQCATNTCSASGPTCECTPTTFFNGTTCTDCILPTGCTAATCTTASNAFCTACSVGHTLTNGVCVDTNACTDHPCGLGTCADKPAPNGNDPDGRTCTCAATAYFDGATCLACSPVDNCQGSVSCTGPNASTCSQCNPGFFGPTCATCSPVDGCATVTCSGLGASTCTSCAPGFELDGAICRDIDACVANPCGLGGSCTDKPAPAGNTAADRTCVCLAGTWFNGTSCQACGPITGCETGLTCDDQGVSTCAQCEPGRYGPTCTSCPPIATCQSGLTCDAAGVSTCATCQPGYFGATCAACPDIENCASNLTCDAAGVSTCGQCDAGFYGPTCATCPTISNCATGLTCDAAGVSTCATCQPGYFGPSCTTCTPVAGCATVTCSAAGASVCTTCDEGFTLSGTVCVEDDPCLVEGVVNYDLIISGVFHKAGPPSFAAIELHAGRDVANLRDYDLVYTHPGIGPPAPLPDRPLLAGQRLVLTDNPAAYADFFGDNGSIIELFPELTDVFDGVIPMLLRDPADVGVDAYGQSGTLGEFTSWDYQNGWAYRNTGATPRATFDVAQWDVAGRNALEGCDDAATCQVPFGTFIAAGNPCGTATCTPSGTDYTCSCPDGSYYGSGACNACTPVAQCAGTTLCTTSADGTCATCNPGFYGPTCSACPALSGCLALTCDAGGATSTCTQCDAGYNLVGGACENTNACAAFDCGNGGICTDKAPPAGNDTAGRECACLGGTFYDGSFCQLCSAITGCESGLTCNSAGASTCAVCDAGRYGPACDTCTAVPGCATVTCNTANASTCTSCNAGFVLSGSTCVDINACTDHPCDTNATCTDIAGAANAPSGRTCQCNNGYSGDGQPGNCAAINLCPTVPTPAAALVITGIVDGNLPNGTPKAVEVYALQDIPLLSAYNLRIATNGGATFGNTFTFPAVTLSAGQFYRAATETTQFTAFFGVAPNANSPTISSNGDDVVGLFRGTTQIDVIGVLGVDGTGTFWDHEDSWIYRKSGTQPKTAFTQADWTFGGVNALDPCATNAACVKAVPIGTYTGPQPTGPNPCNTGTCQTTGPGTYTCTCPTGLFFNGTTCTTCTLPSGCTAATCTTTNDSTCTACSAGFTLSGGACVDINACTDYPCTNGGTCTDLPPTAGNDPDGRTCACVPGTFFNGTVCATCALPDNCTAGTCTAGNPTTCTTCGAGYTLTGGVCVQNDPCASEPSPLTIAGVIHHPDFSALELFAATDIPDLTDYAILFATNVFETLPAGTASAGQVITLTDNAAAYQAFFGVPATASFEDLVFLDGTRGFTLFGGPDTATLDAYGQLDTIGTGTAWDYTRSFAYRLASTSASATFIPTDWEIAGPNHFDTCTTPLECDLPFGTYAGAPSHPCGPGICVPDALANTYTCTCPDGTWFDPDAGTCSACNPIANCATSPLCTTSAASTCGTCTAGYTGPTCSTCAEGYTPSGSTCINVNACIDHPCDTNAACTDLPPSAPNSPTGRTCACNSGYTGDGEVGGCAPTTASGDPRDTHAPRGWRQHPDANGTISTTDTVWIRFNEPIAPATLSAAKVLDGLGDEVAGAWLATDGAWVFNPDLALAPDAYTLELGPTITDLSGNPLHVPTSSSFIVVEGLPLNARNISVLDATTVGATYPLNANTDLWTTTWLNETRLWLRSAGGLVRQLAFVVATSATIHSARTRPSGDHEVIWSAGDRITRTVIPLAGDPITTHIAVNLGGEILNSELVDFTTTSGLRGLVWVDYTSGGASLSYTSAPDGLTFGAVSTLEVLGSIGEVKTAVSNNSVDIAWAEGINPATSVRVLSFRNGAWQPSVTAVTPNGEFYWDLAGSDALRAIAAVSYSPSPGPRVYRAIDRGTGFEVTEGPVHTDLNLEDIFWLGQVGVAVDGDDVVTLWTYLLERTGVHETYPTGVYLAADLGLDAAQVVPGVVWNYAAEDILGSQFASSSGSMPRVALNARKSAHLYSMLTGYLTNPPPDYHVATIDFATTPPTIQVDTKVIDGFAFITGSATPFTTNSPRLITDGTTLAARFTFGYAVPCGSNTPWCATPFVSPNGFSTNLDVGFALSAASARVLSGTVQWMGALGPRVIADGGSPFQIVAYVPGPVELGGDFTLTGRPQVATFASTGGIALATDDIDQPFQGTDCSIPEMRLATIAHRDAAAGLWRPGATVELDPREVTLMSCSNNMQVMAQLDTIALAYASADHLVVALHYRENNSHLTRLIDLRTGQAVAEQRPSIQTMDVPLTHDLKVQNDKAYEFIAHSQGADLVIYGGLPSTLSEVTTRDLANDFGFMDGDYQPESFAIDVHTSGHVAVIAYTNLPVTTARLGSLSPDLTFDQIDLVSSLPGATVSQPLNLVRVIGDDGHMSAPVTRYESNIMYVELHGWTPGASETVDLAAPLSLGTNALINHLSVDATSDRYVIAWRVQGGGLQVSSIALDGTGGWGAPQTIDAAGTQVPHLRSGPGLSSTSILGWVATGSGGTSRPFVARGNLGAGANTPITWTGGSELQIQGTSPWNDVDIDGGGDAGWFVSSRVSGQTVWSFWPLPGD